jgi:ribose 5-phosphate isomerase A
LADPAAQKAAAAAAALELVRDGMLVGLGTGSTAAIFIDLLGKRVQAGLTVTAIPTSRRSHDQALALGIPVLEELKGGEGPIDLAVDGTDEIDPQLNLLKGRGGALVREKLVAVASRRFVVVADETKLVARLGVGVLPVEIVPFLWRRTVARVEELGYPDWSLRGGQEAPFVSDNGNLVVDFHVGEGLADPAAAGARLKAVPGVVEHGLFTGLATACLVGTESGVRVLGSPEGGR